jgi:hypothetical protein
MSLCNPEKAISCPATDQNVTFNILLSHEASTLLRWWAKAIYPYTTTARHGSNCVLDMKPKELAQKWRITVEAQNRDCTVCMRYIKLGLLTMQGAHLLDCRNATKPNNGPIVPSSMTPDPRTQLEVLTGENHPRSNSYAVVSSSLPLTHHWHTWRAIHDIYDVGRSILPMHTRGAASPRPPFQDRLSWSLRLARSIPSARWCLL